MKKRKTDDQPAGDFRNTPFRSLKGFKPKGEKKEERRSPSRKQESPGADESELFLRAVSGARRMENGEEPSAKPGKPIPAEPSALPAQHEEQLFLQAMQKIGAKFPEVRETQDDIGTPQRSSSSRIKQLKRGTIRISAELDLHGFLRDEAIARLAKFIAEASGRSLDAVLVITGKGINSPEGPVLQGAVAEWLRTRGKAMVAEFAPAPRDKGGTGAFVVFLRRTK